MESKKKERVKNTVQFTKSLAISTPEWLRSFKGCEDHTDEEALEVISSLKILAEILLKTNDLVKSYHIDNQLTVSLKGQENENNHLKNAA
jgi:hypothetical protein